MSVARTLLVVDDEPGLCDFVAEVGILSGYVVRTASEAGHIRRELARSADVVVLDLAMPGIDGVEALRVLASQGSKAHVVLVSGFDRRVLEVAATFARQLGLIVGGTLTKPIRAAALREVLSLERVAASKAPASDASAPVNAEELGRAIERGELIVHLQPQVSVASGQTVGVEALVRWNHPRHGLLYPRAFIALAETSNLALPLTLSVLDSAISEFAKVSHTFGVRTTLSVNLSPVALTDVTFPDHAARVVAAAGLAPERAVMEITETSVASDPTAFLDILSRIRLKGFGLSIDDFGTGHSSLTQLRNLPITEMKIDMSFVQGVDFDPTAAAIVGNSVTLGHKLGLHVVAEGVETPRQWEHLKRLDCETVQGFLISPPIPALDLSDWQATWHPPG